jgi:hypothetical protein
LVTTANISDRNGAKIDKGGRILLNFERLQIIAIEIGENCNLNSEHVKCPANSRIINKQYGLLTNEDITLIINEAYYNGFNGEIGFHYYNEPLIYKKRILEIITNCSDAKFLLWTNGLLLDSHVKQNNFLNLFNSIVISNYEEKEKYEFYIELRKVYPNIKRIINYSSTNNLDDRKFIYENANNNIYGCKRPFFIELPIDCYGNVHLCCRDWNNTCILGNVKSQTLLDIIRSEIFCSYEKAIFSAFLDLEHCPNMCKQCDAPDRVFIEIQHDSDPLPRMQSEISFVVVTSAKNEKRLVTLLESLASLKDELVLILDNYDISIFNKLLSYADKVVQIPGKGSFEAYSKDILRHCSKDWIFRIDDDETLNAECTREILQNYISDRTVMSYWIPRKWYINEHEYIVNAPWFPDYQMRLYRNLPGAITLPTRIHEPTLIY